MARRALSAALISIGFFVGFALFAAPSLAAEPHFREADRHVDAPVDQVWAVLEDLRQWRSFTPGLEHLSVEETPTGDFRCRFEVERFGVPIAYSAHVRFDRALGQIHIELDESADRDIEALRTTWTLSEGPDGASTRIELASHFRSGMPVPGFFERRALGKSLNETLDALEGVIEQLPPAAAPVQVAAAH